MMQWLFFCAAMPPLCHHPAYRFFTLLTLVTKTADTTEVSSLTSPTMVAFGEGEIASCRLRRYVRAQAGGCQVEPIPGPAAAPEALDEAPSPSRRRGHSVACSRVVRPGPARSTALFQVGAPSRRLEATCVRPG
jgi:hypothetical protein